MMGILLKIEEEEKLKTILKTDTHDVLYQKFFTMISKHRVAEVILLLPPEDIGREA